MKGVARSLNRRKMCGGAGGGGGGGGWGGGGWGGGGGGGGGGRDVRLFKSSEKTEKTFGKELRRRTKRKEEGGGEKDNAELQKRGMSKEKSLLTNYRRTKTAEKRFGPGRCKARLLGETVSNACREKKTALNNGLSC